MGFLAAAALAAAIPAAEPSPAMWLCFFPEAYGEDGLMMGDDDTLLVLQKDDGEIDQFDPYGLAHGARFAAVHPNGTGGWVIVSEDFPEAGAMLFIQSSDPPLMTENGEFYAAAIGPGDQTLGGPRSGRCAYLRGPAVIDYFNRESGASQ